MKCLRWLRALWQTLFRSSALDRDAEAEIEAYLDASGIRFLEDASNADPRYTRNRIRHQELPRLTSAAGGGAAL